MEIASFVTEHHSIEFHPPLEITTRTCSIQKPVEHLALELGILAMTGAAARRA
jgi:hypothetical protein